MIRADIYFLGTFIKTVVLETDYPPPIVREYAVQPLQVLAYNDWMDEEVMRPVEMQIWIFSLRDRTGPNSWRYDFNGKQSQAYFAVRDVNTFDLGFQEPNEKVNLNILAEKCKKNPRVKELLIKYFRS